MEKQLRLMKLQNVSSLTSVASRVVISVNPVSEVLRIYQLAKQLHLLPRRKGMRFKELTSSPEQLGELANSVRHKPSARGNSPSLSRKQTTAPDTYSFVAVGSKSEVPCRGYPLRWMPQWECIFAGNLSHILGSVSTIRTSLEIQQLHLLPYAWRIL